ncbi:acyltransferase family protein [Pontibacter cellulosilyticus]|uniref:Acyltransferase family protein n=1 Tax=Pontibacter cellulosilyticus TaxID=1720253 RepID=A0A923N3R9_9BACT|nr:acyltransferase family protein [Pontibacter cellulosilyticus]MBC5991701.1 acyltransferase family protein [Pontibacter cellulosilyticus]
MKKHYQQIDVLKGMAIIAVIALHSLTKPELVQGWAIFHIWQAVPVFMIIMGLNLGIGSKPDHLTLSLLYNKAYFTKKATRILIPFLFTFILALFFGLFWEVYFQSNVLELERVVLVGVLPVSGRGNYFITLLLQSILLLPLIGYCFNRRPVLTTIALIALEVLFLLVSKKYSLFEGDDMEYLYSAALPRYFSAFAFGLWLAKAIRQPYRISILLAFLVLGAIAINYLYFVVYRGLSIPFIYNSWAMQNVMSFGYAALLILMVIYTLPSESDNFILQGFAKLGQASYHIFLVQVVYFGLVSDFSNLWLNLAICLLLGYLYYKIETPLSKRYFSFA